MHYSCLTGSCPRNVLCVRWADTHYSPLFMVAPLLHIALLHRYFSRRMPADFLDVAGAVNGGMPVASAIWRSGPVWPHFDMKRHWPRIEAPWQGRQDWA